MNNNAFKRSLLERRTNRKARESWTPAPIPCLSLAFDAAVGAVFAYALQETGVNSSHAILEQLSQALILAFG